MKKKLLLSILIIIFIGINSCKKDSRTSFSEAIMPTATVSSAEILAWFDQTPQVKPANILLSEAVQQTINGKQVVRISVATNAALYFTKENDSLKVYAYKWIYNTPYTDKYTGKIDIYNFQDQTFKQQVYTNGVLSRVKLLRKRPPLSVSGSLQTFDIWAGLAEIWCYITGGDWKESDPDSSGSANGEVREPGCDYSASSDQLGGNPPALPDDVYADDSGDVYTTTSGGSGGGIGWGPPPCPPGSVIVNSANKNHVNNMPLPPGGSGCPTAPDGSAWLPYSVFGSNTFAASLVQTLNITDSRKEMFLILNKDIAYELYIFLQQHGDSPAIEDQLNGSIDYLMANPSFVVGSNVVPQTVIIRNLPLTANQFNYIINHGDDAAALAEIFTEDDNTTENTIITQTVVEFLTDQNSAMPSSTFPTLASLKADIKNAISQGVTSTAAVMRKIYLALNTVTTNHPSLVTSANFFLLDPIRSDINNQVNFNTQTFNWGDMFNIWMFELGNFPIGINNTETISINNGANIITGNNLTAPQINAIGNLKTVSVLRSTTVDKLQQGTIQPNGILNASFTYDVNAFYGSLAQQNEALIFLGSYGVSAKVNAINGNSATVTFTLTNTSGWESATRLMKAQPGSSLHQGIVNDKPRGSGLHLGGNLNEIYTWTETISF